MSDGGVSGMARPSVDDVLGILELEKEDEGRYTAPCIAAEGPVVFGGQMIAQAIVAATAEAAGKRVTSISSNFARTGRSDTPVTLDVEKFHEGRSLASITVTVRQGDRRLARSLVLLGAEEDDVIRHASSAPSVGSPDASPAKPAGLSGWEQRNVGDVDLFDPALTGPPELQFWSQFATDRTERDIAQAFLTWASVNFFIGTAMRPHEGVGLSRAHRDLSTGVLSHTLYFHDDFTAGEWLLYSLRSSFSGGGRAFGVGEVFTESGRLVATATQESMIRPMSGGSGL